MGMKPFFILAVCTLLLQSCAYPIAQDLVDRSDKTVSFSMLQTDSDRYHGKLVILGGRIAGVTSLTMGTLLEVDEAPLDYWGKPLRRGAAQGRFLVYSPAYLDPMNYVAGREITVAGEVQGTSLKLPDEGKAKKYPYPVLRSRQIKLWPRARNLAEPEWLDPLYNVMNPSQRQF